MEDNITPLFRIKIMGYKIKRFDRFTEMYTVDFYYFMGSTWCLLAFKVLEFSKLHPSVFKLNPFRKKGFYLRFSKISFADRFLK